MPAVLGYWKIRGLAQHIRLLLNYVGEEFEDKYYECGPAPTYNRDCWFNEKFTLDLDFPNLPYYIDGDVKLTQSGAITHYIARRHNLCGTTEKHKWRVDLVENVLQDMRGALARLCYSSAENFAKHKPQYVKDMAVKMQQLENFLGSGPWIAEDQLTFVDFILYELLDCNRILDSSILDGCTNLEAFLRRFEALPAIQKYMESDKFMKTPLNNKMAAFGGQ